MVTLMINKYLIVISQMIKKSLIDFIATLLINWQCIAILLTAYNKYYIIKLCKNIRERV